jgi:hypothetical protein
MNKFAECCRVLGLETVKSEKQVKETYRRAIKRWHPDKYVSDEEKFREALEKIKDINLAYEYVSGALKGNLDLKKERQPVGRSATGLPDNATLEIHLRSSRLLSAGYDYENNTLLLKFTNLNVYKFFGVPPTVFEELLTAHSHGRYAQQNIYSRFPYVCCHRQTPAAGSAPPAQSKAVSSKNRRAFSGFGKSLDSPVIKRVRFIFNSIFATFAPR